MPGPIKIEDHKSMLSVEQLKILMKRESAFRKYAEVVGQQVAEETLVDIHFVYTVKYKQKGVMMEHNKWDSNMDDMRKTFVRLRTQVLSTKAHIDGLYKKARSGELGRDLRKPENFMKPADYGASDRDIDSVKGAKWIKRVSNSNEMSAEEIASVIVECRTTRRSVFSLDTLKFLHNKLVPKGSIDARRGPSSDRTFPSFSGAKVLQRMVAEKVSSVKPKALKWAEWDSYACYFLGAYMHAHGFADGNGRPNRALFVLAMLEGLREFVAPVEGFVEKPAKLLKG